LHIGIGVFIKKNVKCGSAARAFSLAILCAILHVIVHGVSTDVKVVGIIGKGLWIRDVIGHGLILYWWLGYSGNIVDWGCCMVNKGW
jgi:hypothetical protein